MVILDGKGTSDQIKLEIRDEVNNSRKIFNNNSWKSFKGQWQGI